MWSWEYDGQPTEENALPWGEMAIDVYLIVSGELHDDVLRVISLRCSGKLGGKLPHG